ncbi:hypothetical protein MSG28_000001 [Choristoneura fumiferana]|uniref:Uncharacterized protein n=1 Tax=Choristoneura fumiferana TaxID=7141 RepID=A0ACC0JZF7_CHOFU|nr:hypothetical protein MSG28_000001 [Choristoneura fumiferana]
MSAWRPPRTSESSGARGRARGGGRRVRVGVAGFTFYRSLRRTGAGTRRVFGGAPAGAWTPACALLDRSLVALCSGAVLAPRWALTAAHCVHPNVAYVRYNGRSSDDNLAAVHLLYAHPDYRVKHLDEGEGLDVVLLHHDVGLVYTRRDMLLAAPPATAPRAPAAPAPAGIPRYEPPRRAPATPCACCHPMTWITSWDRRSRRLRLQLITGTRAPTSTAWPRAVSILHGFVWACAHYINSVASPDRLTREVSIQMLGYGRTERAGVGAALRGARLRVVACQRGADACGTAAAPSGTRPASAPATPAGPCSTMAARSVVTSMGPLQCAVGVGGADGAPALSVFTALKPYAGLINATMSGSKHATRMRRMPSRAPPRAPLLLPLLLPLPRLLTAAHRLPNH